MDASKTVRGAAGTAAIMAMLAALSQFKTVQEAVVWVGTSAGGGIALWGIVALASGPLKRIFPTTYRTIKFYLAQGLAFAIPIGAYTVMVNYGWATWGYAGLVASVAAAYNLSQLIHWEEADPPTPPAEGVVPA